MKGRIAYALGPERPLEIEEFEVGGPAPGEVLVRVLAAGICGSDIHNYRGEVPYLTPFPCAQGHEMVGEVAELGVGVSTDSLGRPLAAGDRVAYSYFAPCGACPACNAGSSACPNRYALRAELTVHDPPHFHGAFGDYYYVGPGQWIFRLPEGLAVEHAVPANCAVAQALAAVSKARIEIGDAVVVQGLGGLGAYAAALAKDSGARLVIGVDAIPARLELGRGFGVDTTIDIGAVPDVEDRVAAVHEATEGAGADVVIEMAGVPDAVPEGISYLRFGGRYVLVGNIQAEAETTLVPTTIVRAGRELAGVVTYGRRVLPRALDWLAHSEGRYPFEQLVADRYPLERINDAFAAADWAASSGNPGRAIVSMTER